MLAFPERQTWLSRLWPRTPEPKPAGISLSEMDRLEALATCAWVREKENLLIQGPPGVGRTHLAVALAVRAMANGFSVAFHRLDTLLASLERDAGGSPEVLRPRKHLNAALLVVDEVGNAPITRDQASLFLGLVSCRDGRGSILIVANKGIAESSAAQAGDDLLATTILDRLLLRSHVLDMSGSNYRLRELDRPLASSSAAY